MTTDADGRVDSALCDQLGPEERAKLDALLDHVYEYGTTAEGVLRLAAQLCQAARAAERERCAHVCAGIAAGYAGEARRRLTAQHATHAAGQRDGANECAAAIRRA